MIPSGVFVSATGTGIGKTFVSRGLARALTIRNYSVCALKPIETGCAPDPVDAIALGRACSHPELAHAKGLYRARLALSPYAVSLQTETPPPDIAFLTEQVKCLSRSFDFVLVESAGGLFAPIDRRLSMADFSLALHLPLLVVSSDILGVISHALTLAECAASRGIDIAAFVLVQQRPDKTSNGLGSNLAILSERLPQPVIAFPFCADDDDALAAAVDSSGLLRALGLSDYSR